MLAISLDLVWCAPCCLIYFYFLLSLSFYFCLLRYFTFVSHCLLSLAEEAGHHKLAAQYIQRELREADEANLIDEEGIMFSSFFTSSPVAWHGR